ncbi:MAG: carbon starvation protein A [Candidatus Aminicenantes bacterium]|nr:carbon starvation protein A [Candidatus Aminicenantes bacterium]
MNALVLGILIILWLFLAYKIYGAQIDRRVINPDDSLCTPANSLCDGVDYHPAKTPLLFGHHFSSIAGAGPIIGPLMGVLYFGWLGALLWIVLGSVFIGAVHDYTSLMTSVRNKGRSIPDISETILGKRARIIFSVFVWLALILVISVFSVVTSQTFISKPEIVIPTFGLIFLAVLFGWLVYRKGFNVFVGTVVAVALLAFLIYLGELFPVRLPPSVFGISASTVWILILMIYCLFASTLPVWFLLQPRDYLSMWILFLGLFLGYVGLIFGRPKMNAPPFVSFMGKEGPLWPMLFVLIACGAISGFHSLIAGGTTAKQLPKESKGKLIGFGGMLTEASLAALVVLIASSALVWDPSEVVNPFGFQYLMKPVEQGGGGGPIVAFATGFGRFVSAIPIIPLAFGIFYGTLMLNAFVLTTLDTATRLGRYIFDELLGKKIPFLANKWWPTLITISFATLLALSEGYKAIWPVFGASNQLVAALALITVSGYLISVRKPSKYTLYPAIFMLLTTISALLYQGYNFCLRGRFLLGTISFLLVGLAGLIVYDGRRIILSWSKPSI